MFQSAHVLIDLEGRFRAVDGAFASMIGIDAEALIGLPILDVTAAEDRPACRAALATLRETHRCQQIVKRLVRGDRSIVWTSDNLSISCGPGEQAVVIGTVQPIAPPAPVRSPGRLLKAARACLERQEGRRLVCDPHLLTDSAWDIILLAYTAEAQGEAVSCQSLAGRGGLAVSTCRRWIKALIDAGVLEAEVHHGDGDRPASYRLTADVHGRLEIYLAAVEERFEPGRRTSAPAVPLAG